MKISNSKKELARIISDNGGWRDGNYAIKDKDDMRVWFTHKIKGKPCGNPYWTCHKSHAINHHSLLPNWHQTILSREEYFHLYPAPDADGWIEWSGGDASPVAKGVAVDVKMKNGTEHYGQILSDACWHGSRGEASITAYRLHKQEHSEQEYPDGIKPTDPAKQEQTIEQLAADYRNAKDYADRKQEEADAAKADAEAKLEELIAASKELGLVHVSAVKAAIDGCMQLVDMVPTRLQSHQEESVAAIGYVVNVERLYDKVRDVFDLLK